MYYDVFHWQINIDNLLESLVKCTCLDFPWTHNTVQFLKSTRRVFAINYVQKSIVVHESIDVLSSANLLRFLEKKNSSKNRIIDKLNIYNHDYTSAFITSNIPSCLV